MTASTKDQLDLKVLRSAFDAQVKEIETIGNSFKIDPDGSNVEITTEQHTAYAKAVEKAEELKALITTQEKARGLFEFLDTPERRTVASEVNAKDGPTGRPTGAATKALSEAFFESDSWKNLAEKGFKGDPFAMAAFEQSLTGFSGLNVKDIYSTMAGEIPINALGTPQNLGLTPRILRPGRVRDLFPKETTTANLLYGIRETGFVNRAAVVSERRAADGVSAPTGSASDVFGLKPRSDLSIEPVIYPVATIK